MDGIRDSLFLFLNTRNELDAAREDAIDLCDSAAGLHVCAI